MVVHVRGLVDGVTEADLVEGLQEFGTIRYEMELIGMEKGLNSQCVIFFSEEHKIQCVANVHSGYILTLDPALLLIVAMWL